MSPKEHPVWVRSHFTLLVALSFGCSDPTASADAGAARDAPAIDVRGVDASMPAIDAAGIDAPPSTTDAAGVMDAGAQCGVENRLVVLDFDRLADRFNGQFVTHGSCPFSVGRKSSDLLPQVALFL